jgi:NADPH:quinone reductase-like Zn-dependent oxidoreductase
MMKAARFSQFGGPEVLKIVDLPDPHAGPGQIRVAVHAAGVNPTDWRLRKGLMGGELPQTTGREVAGVVDEVSTSPGAACCPSSSSSRAARRTS